MAQKFIITDGGEFRLGDVKLHRELLDSWEDCWGGGFWSFDPVNVRLMLDGASYDFGAPQWGRLIREGMTLSVPQAYRGVPIDYTRDDGTIMHVSRVLDIEYYAPEEEDPA